MKPLLVSGHKVLAVLLEEKFANNGRYSLISIQKSMILR
jgi:hypothetical protein